MLHRRLACLSFYTLCSSCCCCCCRCCCCCCLGRVPDGGRKCPLLFVFTPIPSFRPRENMPPGIACSRTCSASDKGWRCGFPNLGRKKRRSKTFIAGDRQLPTRYLVLYYWYLFMLLLILVTTVGDKGRVQLSCRDLVKISHGGVTVSYRS